MQAGRQMKQASPTVIAPVQEAGLMINFPGLPERFFAAMLPVAFFW